MIDWYLSSTTNSFLQTEISLVLLLEVIHKSNIHIHICTWLHNIKLGFTFTFLLHLSKQQSYSWRIQKLKNLIPSCCHNTPDAIIKSENCNGWILEMWDGGGRLGAGDCFLTKSLLISKMDSKTNFLKVAEISWNWKNTII